ncbi:hypothetical protein, partial [Pseudomonas aeruginosa]|uniref:hypothetical protein n=1 Tax=Pseudomonas aeruginosa TaxID=287 RepID=UPI0031B813EE
SSVRFLEHQRRAAAFFCAQLFKFITIDTNQRMGRASRHTRRAVFTMVAQVAFIGFGCQGTP